jgi:hypothetical protein
MLNLETWEKNKPKILKDNDCAAFEKGLKEYEPLFHACLGHPPLGRSNAKFLTAIAHLHSHLEPARHALHDHCKNSEPKAAHFLEQFKDEIAKEIKQVTGWQESYLKVVRDLVGRRKKELDEIQGHQKGN